MAVSDIRFKFITQRTHTIRTLDAGQEHRTIREQTRYSRHGDRIRCWSVAAPKDISRLIVIKLVSVRFVSESCYKLEIITPCAHPLEECEYIN